MLDSQISSYVNQSRWTDPGAYGSLFKVLPSDPTALPEVLAGLILHPGVAPGRGIQVRDTSRSDPELRTVQSLLRTLLGRDDCALNEARQPGDRLFATCRHYALLGASILRDKGVPTRLRVGFANYFNPGFAEDHWVCEHHDGVVWKLCDAELGAVTSEQFKILFPPHDVPRDSFLSAAAIWQRLRRGEIDEGRVGVSGIGISGAWFAASSLLRDAVALVMEEMQPWDYWGPAREFVTSRSVGPEWLDRLDQLAQSLASKPQGYDDANGVLTTYPWATLTPTVLSFPTGEPAEESIS